MAGLNHARADWSDWLPIRAWRSDREWGIDWCHFGQQPLCEPFFRDSVEVALRRPFNLAFGRRTGFDALLDWQARSPGVAPAVFVLHASRCGSTLLAQVLAGMASHVVLSEPPPLDAVLRAHHDDPSVAESQPAWIAALLSAWGQRRRGTERALVAKLDAWNIFELPLLRRACPDTPWIYLYRDPLAIVASHLEEPGRQMVPGLIGASPLALAMDEHTMVSRAEYVARVTGLLLATGLEQCATHDGIVVNYDELPEAIGGRLAGVLGLDASDAARAGSGLQRHSKRPREAFESDDLRKHEALDATVREHVARWAMPSYLALERLRAEQRAGDEHQAVGSTRIAPRM
jgi:hypothetical protein